MTNNDFCSIIMTHYAMNAERSDMLKISLQSLRPSTDYPYELIVIDNGNSITDSRYLLGLASSGYINTYIRNANNMSFGYARNQGIALSNGKYIAIVDNDIKYESGWLEQCVEILEAFPDKKIYATPMPYPMVGLNHRYHAGFLNYNNKEYELHSRAGSNCFVIRKNDLLEIGLFRNHRIAGSLWTDAATNKGYFAAVLPSVPATDLGLRRGYNIKKSHPIDLVLSNGVRINFNEDEYAKL